MLHLSAPRRARWLGWSLAAIIMAAFAAPLSAQWSNDSAVNTFIAGTGNDRTLPKVAYDRPDSCWYVSSFASDTLTNFSVWLQRLDHDGNRLWGDDGLAVSRHPFNTWISDYSLACDSTGGAVLAFADLRAGNGYSNVYMYKMNASGAYCWDSAGLALTSDSSNKYSPTLAVTPENNLLCAWSIIYDNNKIAVGVQRVTAGGQVSWPAPLLVTGGDSTCSMPQLLALPGEQFILVWYKEVSTFNNSAYAQRFDSLGNPVWPSPVAICDLGIIKAWTNLQVAPVTNGFYTSWDDARTMSTTNPYVMYTGYDGATTWSANGVLASVNTGMNQFVGALAVLPSSQEPVVLWKDANPAQTYEGMSGQKLSTSGQRLWGDSGIAYVPLCLGTDTTLMNVQALPGRDNTVGIVYQKEYTASSVQDDLTAFRLASDGTYSWAQHMVPVSTSQYDKSSLVAAANAGLDRYLAVWHDNRDAGPYAYEGKIFGQAIDDDGTLPNGVAGTPVSEHQPPRFMLQPSYPNPTSGRTTFSFNLPKGGQVNLSVYNVAGQLVKTLVNGVQPAGTHNVTWNGTDNDGRRVSSGAYLYRLTSSNSIATRKLVILR